MSKPIIGPSHWEYWKNVRAKTTLSEAFDMGYTAGLRDGAERERRALKRWLKKAFWGTWMYEAGIDWLASRKNKHE